MGLSSFPPTAQFLQILVCPRLFIEYSCDSKGNAMEGRCSLASSGGIIAFQIPQNFDGGDANM